MSGSQLETVLVTGFPGFRANYLVRQLLQSGGRKVVVVAPPGSDPLVSEVRGQLPEFGGRLEVLSGSATALDMGLSGPEYLRISEEVSDVHHVSIALDTGLSGAGLLSGPAKPPNRENVSSMRETLAFAQACPKLRALYVHSSVFVCGDFEGEFLESHLNVGQSFPLPGLESLAVAEKMARAAQATLPIGIVRSAQVVGEPLAGSLTSLDGLYRLILLALLAPREMLELLPSSGDVRIHALEVDAWLECVDQVAGPRLGLGQTVHIARSNAWTLRQVFHQLLEIRSRMLENGEEMPTLGRVFLKEPLLREQVHKMIYRPRAFLDMAYRNVVFDTSTASRLVPDLLNAPLRLEPLVRQVVDLVRSGVAVNS